MNAAEQLVRATLGDTDSRTTTLVNAAHEEIIAQYVAEAGDTGNDPARLGGVAVADAPATGVLETTMRRMGVVAAEVAFALSGSSSVAKRIVSAVRAGLLTRGGGLKTAAILAAAFPGKARWIGGAALAGVILLALAATALALASGSWLASLLA